MTVNSDDTELSQRQAAKQSEANNNQISTESNDGEVEEAGQSGEKVEFISNLNSMYLLLPSTIFVICFMPRIVADPNLIF